MNKIYKLSLFFMISMFCFAQSQEGFYKKSESKVSFKGIGEYIEKRETKSTADLAKSECYSECFGAKRRDLTTPDEIARITELLVLVSTELLSVFVEV